MIEQTAPSDEQLERAAQVVTQHAARARLCALGYEVLSRQAEGGGLFAGEKFAEQRGEAHSLTREDAETPLGNLLTLVERGPERASEHALLAAAFVGGFGDAALAELKPEQRAARVTRFVEHAEWLELRTVYRVLPLVERMLDVVLVGAIYEQLGARVLQAPAAATVAQQRSLQAGRVALLTQGTLQVARDVLGRIADAQGDDGAALLAAHALGRRPGAVTNVEARPLSVRGPAGAALRGVVTWLLRTVTGLSLLSWLGRASLRVLGVRREVELTLRGSGVTVQRRLSWLGRELRSERELRPVLALRVARRSARFVGVYRSLATLCFALSVLVAGRLAVEAALAAESTLWAWAAALALAGSAIDLVVAAWLPGRAGRVTLEVDLGGGARGRIAEVALADADAFLAALTVELERAPKGASRGVA